jgi:uncharacterized DUF497 family protein
MDIAYRLSGIDFVWDREKAKANLRKHDIAFETACEVFFDPFICLIGTDVVRGEERETVIGMTSNWRLLNVIYVFRSETVRLISARTVTIGERKTYEEQ